MSFIVQVSKNISLVLPRQTISFAGSCQYIETCPLGVLVDSVEKDLVYEENNGAQDVYNVQRIADSKYAAKEPCGPIAYKGGPAAWPRIA